MRLTRQMRSVKLRPSGPQLQTLIEPYQALQPLTRYYLLSPSKLGLLVMLYSQQVSEDRYSLHDMQSRVYTSISVHAFSTNSGHVAWQTTRTLLQIVFLVYVHCVDADFGISLQP